MFSPAARFRAPMLASLMIASLTLANPAQAGGVRAAVPAGPQVQRGAMATPETEYIVSADLLDGAERPDDPHCALAVSANHINGSFVAVVLKLMPGEAEPRMQIKISPGVVDWRYGIESYTEPDRAWLEFGSLSTEGTGAVTSKALAAVHERMVSGAVAGEIYETALAAPLTVKVESAGVASRFPLDRVFEAEVVERARACASGLLARR